MAREQGLQLQINSNICIDEGRELQLESSNEQETLRHIDILRNGGFGHNNSSNQGFDLYTDDKFNLGLHL